MSPQIHRGRTAGRVCPGLLALGCAFAGIVAANAQQPPVITNPGDVRTLTVNTAFSPGDPDPAWTGMAPMPTARAGFAAAAANGKVYAMGGAVLNNCTTVPISRGLRSGCGLLDNRIGSHAPSTSFPAGRWHARQPDLCGWRSDDGHLSATTRPSAQSRPTTQRQTVGLTGKTSLTRSASSRSRRR